MNSHDSTRHDSAIHPLTANSPDNRTTHYYINGREVTEQEFSRLSGRRTLHSILHVHATTSAPESSADST